MSLQAIESPFIVSDTYPNLDDVKDFLLALWVCSKPVTPNENAAFRRVSLWKRIDGKLLGLARLLNPDRVYREMERMWDYVNGPMQFKAPTRPAKKDIARISTCPSFIPMQRCLMNHYGFSEAEALNMPMKKAKWLYGGWLEHEGAVEFRRTTSEALVEIAARPEIQEWVQKLYSQPRKEVAKN